jgi:pyrroline-5-carboxylate reductase
MRLGVSIVFQQVNLRPCTTVVRVLPPLSVPIQESEAGIMPSARAHDLAHVEQLFEHFGLRRLVRPMPPVTLKKGGRPRITAGYRR